MKMADVRALIGGASKDNWLLASFVGSSLKQKQPVDVIIHKSVRKAKANYINGKIKYVYNY